MTSGSTVEQEALKVYRDNRPFAQPGHITYIAGEQVEQSDFQNRGRCIVLEVPCTVQLAHQYM